MVPMTGEDNNGFLKAWQLEPSGFTSIAVSCPHGLVLKLCIAIDILQGKATKDIVMPVDRITDKDLASSSFDLPDSFWANSRLTEAEIKALFKR